MTSALPKDHPGISSLPREVPAAVRSGKELFGDDFDEHQVAEWIAQEREAFFAQDAGNSDVDPWYAYMRYVNHVLGFARIEPAASEERSVLVLGPGSGIEIERFAAANPNWRLCFMEASENFRAQLARRWPTATIIEPTSAGEIGLPDASQDLVCAFSVLHHVAKVSSVVREVYRVLRPGGSLIVREPCSSMGDWRYPRAATPNERGIAKALMVDIARRTGLVEAVTPVPILFEPINRVLRRTIGFSVVPFRLLFAVDRCVSWLAAFNDHYWRDTWYKKLGPSSYFYIFRKSAAG